MADVDARAWERLVEISERQVAAKEQSNLLLGRIIEMQHDAKEAHEASVVELKKHMSETLVAAMKSSEMWWRRAVMVAVGLIVLSNIVGVALIRYIGLIKQ